MISRIIELCARNRFLVFTGVLLLTLAGIWSLKQVPLDALPISPMSKWSFTQIGPVNPPMSSKIKSPTPS